MVFSSLVFIYLFLPVHLLFYYLTPSKYKNYVLLLFSLIFYAWAGPVFLLVLLGEAFVGYFFALKISKTKKKLLFIAGITILIATLVFFKYLYFLSTIVNSMLNLTELPQIIVPTITLPIGISFYTFQLISYLADVYRGQVEANPSFSKVLLYTSLFHQCIAGPIVRYKTVSDEIDNRHSDWNDVYEGIMRFSIGLAKKAVLANSVAAIVDKICNNGMESLTSQSVGALWVMAICYSLQIYLDFSAYSDMAIGMGRMIGFHYLENFNYPYISSSVNEFWRRWHISLSTFFRDYIYIPLGGNRVGKGRHIFNLIVVWALTGLWHGASMNFIFWGLYYFVFLVFEKYILKNKEIKVIGNIFTLLVVIVGWVIFKFDNSTELIYVLRTMFGFSGKQLWNINASTILLSNLFLIIVSVIACTPLFSIIYKKILSSEKKVSQCLTAFIEIILPPVFLILATLALVGNSYNPFIYFRF